MRSYRRSARAEQDLIDIWLHIALESPAAADRVLDKIDAACIGLAEYPKIGPARPDLAPGLRYFVVGSYLLLYREDASGVEIVRVVHGARLLPEFFRGHE